MFANPCSLASCVFLRFWLYFLKLACCFGAFLFHFFNAFSYAVLSNLGGPVSPCFNLKNLGSLALGFGSTLGGRPGDLGLKPVGISGFLAKSGRNLLNFFNASSNSFFVLKSDRFGMFPLKAL